MAKSVLQSVILSARGGKGGAILQTKVHRG